MGPRPAWGKAMLVKYHKNGQIFTLSIHSYMLFVRCSSFIILVIISDLQIWAPIRVSSAAVSRCFASWEEVEHHPKIIRKFTPLQFPASASVSAPIWAIQEGIFEIRDFTNASTFERLSHQISLATKHWAVALTSSEDARDEVLQMKDGFELGGFKCLWWRFREQR